MANKDILQIVAGHQTFAPAASAMVSQATFDQSGNATTALATAADLGANLNLGTLTLLTDAITALGTVQTRINALETRVNLQMHLINKLIDVLQAAGNAS